MPKKVMKKLKEEVKKRPQVVSHRKWKEGKSKMIASCGFLEDELRQCSKEGGTLADSVESLASIGEPESRSWEQKKEVQTEILDYQEE